MESLIEQVEERPDDDLELQSTFLENLISELEKVEFFFSENLKYYKSRLKKISDQLDYIKKNKHFKKFKENLETAVKELFKESNLMRIYIEMNLKAKTKIVKKFMKYTKFYKHRIEVDKITDNFIQKSNYLKDPLPHIAEIQSSIEKIFSTNFFEKHSFNAVKILKDYSNPSYFTQTQSFYFGFSCGILSILFSLCVLIGVYFNIDMDDDAEFKMVFPMFRGFLILCIYFWFLGINTYAWNKANVNYRLCFGFKDHYSNVISIFKRAAAFTTIFVLLILCYLILRTKLPVLSDLISFIPVEITPLLCWIFLLFYTFFPIKIFNYPGRVYLFNLLIESCASIFVKCEFKHVWFTDQLTSLIGTIRDIEYTACYYSHYANSFEEKKILCSNRRGVILLIGIFPHIIRTLQCFRSIYDSKHFFPQIINAGKYLIAIIVAIFSFLASNYAILDNIWWLFALISTIYSYAWDLKMDFGFLQHGANYPLREKLSYKNKMFYYFCLIINLFLRFMWVLTVSPDVVYKFIRPEFFLFLIYTMEVFRRGMWNFIRVEYKHIEICKEFKVTLDVELPFKKNSKGEFVLRNAPLVQIEKMNRRLERIKSIKYLDDLSKGSFRSSLHSNKDRDKITVNPNNFENKNYFIKSVSKTNLRESIIELEKASSKGYIKEYESSDYKNNLNTYLKLFYNKEKANNKK
jgi:hypothetical protein